MGRKAILAVVCWLTISQAFGDKGKAAQLAAVKDNESAESAPRLYRNVPLGVYASAAPYASYSFHLPQFLPVPNAAASQLAPVQQKPVNKNVNTYLMDSYGNRYFEGPQQAPYKAAFPQQYVSLQPKLPEHLAQPLVAASPNFQFKQSAPQVFFGAPFRVPALQSPAPTPLNQFPSFGHLMYAGNVQSLAPTSNIHNNGFRVPNAQQQSTNNKAVFSNTQPHEQYSNLKNQPTFQRQQELPDVIVGKPKIQNVQEKGPVSHGEPKFQRIQEIPHGAHGEVKFQRIQEKPNSDSSESKHQQVHDISHSSYDHPKFERIEESSPHASHEEEKSHRIHEIPHEEHGGPKYQRFQESPEVVHVEHSYEPQQEAPKPVEKKAPGTKARLQSAPAKQTTITYVNEFNGKKNIVKVQSDPLPLLDLTLLEPLTFANPLVPQVQHFLPRINQATYQKLPQPNIGDVKNYQKEFVVQKTMSYDSGNINKPQKQANKKKEKKPTYKQSKKNDAPKKTTVTHHETLDDAPEIVYEINAPGHKETISEKTISYNKETQSEPVHYSYGSKSQKEPVTYSFSRSSKEPLQIKEVHYHGNGPMHLVYNFKPEEQHHQHHQQEEQHHQHTNEPHGDGENHKHHESSHESENSGPAHHHHHQHTENYKDHPKSSEEHHEPPHKEQEHHRGASHENHHEPVHTNQPKYYPGSGQTKIHFDYEPITQEYEEDIRLLANAQIKVDPSQHVQPKSKEREQSPQEDEESHPPHRHHHSSHEKHSHQSAPQQSHQHYSPPQSGTYHGPAAHVMEKSKRIIIHDESPDEMHMHQEQMKEEVIDREENNEEDFEKAYKNAAIGFPAYTNEALEAAEKDIFDPESYGVPPDHVEYNVEHTPFQQYQEEGDEFPKEARSSYKDSRDKMKENYYTDYSISKPESLLDRYQNKLGYYKLYKQQKPDYYVSDDKEDDKKKQKPKFAKYSVAPTFGFPKKKEEKTESFYGSHKPKQQLYEYDYSKGAPRDSSAFASRPFQRYRSKTNFVEPQFQYGFEPITIPKLLDSELAAMASSHNPESEKPGMRKKVYKENWYIKKTSTAAGAPAS
nr:uncharacterized protein LOC110380760 [Helicoverpa armigera]XP_049692013.1 uncharacterized protein LOC126053589 [Helicoverpa armigera]